MKRKSHKNTTRLNARERAHAVCARRGLCPWRHGDDFFEHGVLCDEVTRVQQAHARQALARERARRGGAR